MNKKQKETDKFALKAIAWVLIIFITLFLFASLMGYNEFNKEVQDKLKEDPREIPSRMINYNTGKITEDIVMDSLEMDCGE